MKKCKGCDIYYNLKTLEKNDGDHCKKCYFDVLKELTITQKHTIDSQGQIIRTKKKIIPKPKPKKEVHIKYVNINQDTCYELLSRNNIFVKEEDSLDLDTGEYKDCKVYVKYSDEYILEYQGDIIDTKKEGYGVYQYIDDDSEKYEYKGQWKNGTQHGQGICEYLGDKYTGDWENGLHHGEGTTEYKNGDVYTGEYHLDKRTGKGKKTYTNGTTYEGYWKDGKRHGQGTLGRLGQYRGGFAKPSPISPQLAEFIGEDKDTLVARTTVTRFITKYVKEHNLQDPKNKRHIIPDASLGKILGPVDVEITYFNLQKFLKKHYPPIFQITYEGEWKGDQRHGQGKWTDPDGDTYEGEWEYGERHGQGKETCLLTGTYEGEWEYGERHGQGKATYANGSTYEGGWKDGQEHGQGKDTYAWGDTYDGEYKDGLEHGQGKYTHAGLGTYEGEWKDGLEHGYGNYTNKSGLEKYKGEWVNGKKHGKGICYNTDINISGPKKLWVKSYEGEYKDGKRNGEGKIYQFGKMIYDGDVLNNFKHGYGIEYENDLEKRSGLWDSNEFIGEVKEGEVCLICQFRKKDMIFIPCGHLCICEKCSEKYEDDKCIMCRKEFSIPHKVYS